jgi:hypothetical protein
VALKSYVCYFRVKALSLQNSDFDCTVNEKRKLKVLNDAVSCTAIHVQVVKWLLFDYFGQVILLSALYSADTVGAIDHAPNGTERYYQAALSWRARLNRLHEGPSNLQGKI